MFVNTFWSLVPPIVAIGLALLTKETYSSLFIGIVVGALLATDFSPIGALDTIITDGLTAAIADNAGIFLFLVILGVMVALVTAYGPDAFGPDKSFVAAQASVVATMVSGIPSVPWFAGGFIAGIVMYWLGIPAMMIGLGVYLPFYMSLTAFLGSCVKLAYDKWSAHRDATAGLSDEERAAKDAAFQEQGLVVASGLLGGESIVGVILAFVSVGLSLLG